MGAHLRELRERELSDEYQHYRVYMVVKKLCILVLRTQVALALEGLIFHPAIPKNEIFIVLPSSKNTLFFL